LLHKGLKVEQAHIEDIRIKLSKAQNELITQNQRTAHNEQLSIAHQQQMEIIQKLQADNRKVSPYCHKIIRSSNLILQLKRYQEVSAKQQLTIKKMELIFGKKFGINPWQQVALSHEPQHNQQQQQREEEEAEKKIELLRKRITELESQTMTELPASAAAVDKSVEQEIQQLTMKAHRAETRAVAAEREVQEMAKRFAQQLTAVRIQISQTHAT